MILRLALLAPHGKTWPYTYYNTVSCNIRLDAVLTREGLVSEGANQYPCQLQQATTLLEHLVHTENVPPSSIMLVGDSAGGHLLVNLMFHVRHPHPQVAPLKIEGDLAGAVIVSPWLNLHEMPETMRTCERPDMLDTKALAYWAKNFLAGAPSDYWNDPLTAPTEWWSDLPVGDIFLTFGSDELLHDGDARLGEILQSCHHGATTVMRCVGELHDHMIMNRFLFINKPCESEEGYKQWLERSMTAR